MTAKDAIRHDDWKNDEDNPLIPFRMSDRQAIYRAELKVNVVLAISIFIAGLAGTGMALRFL